MTTRVVTFRARVTASQPTVYRATLRFLRLCLEVEDGEHAGRRIRTGAAVDSPRWGELLTTLGLTRYEDDPEAVAALAVGRHVGIVVRLHTPTLWDPAELNVPESVWVIERFVSWGDVPIEVRL